MEFIFKLNIQFLFVLFSISALNAQDSVTKSKIIEKGFLIGIGNGLDTFNLPEGRYVPVFFMAHIGLNLKYGKVSKRKNPALFTIYIEPQLNPVFIKKKEDIKKNLEFGTNVGFKHMYPILKNLYSYILIGSGPQFFTTSTVRQAKGFLFSDNLGTGIYLFLNKTVAINIGFRLRHMSNANTRIPNHGINTYNYHLGLSRIIR